MSQDALDGWVPKQCTRAPAWLPFRSDALRPSLMAVTNPIHELHVQIRYVPPLTPSCTQAYTAISHNAIHGVHAQTRNLPPPNLTSLRKEGDSQISLVWRRSLRGRAARWWR